MGTSRAWLCSSTGPGGDPHPPPAARVGLCHIPPPAASNGRFLSPRRLPVTQAPPLPWRRREAGGGSAEGEQGRAGAIPRRGEPQTDPAAAAQGTLGPAGPCLRAGVGAAAARRAPGAAPPWRGSPQGRRLPPEQARRSPGVAARHGGGAEGLRECLGAGASAPRFWREYPRHVPLQFEFVLVPYTFLFISRPFTAFWF